MLTVRDLCVSFRTEQGVVRAVDHVSFDVAEGEILGVVGESGSGKTVSLLSVIGLIIDPNAIIEGSIVYKGRELIGLPQRELRHVRGNEIAMIFQDPMTALTPVYTIGWQIAEQVMTHNKMSKAAARQRAVDLLAEVGFANPAIAVDRYPHELSGGMQQRVAIARALAYNPAVLLMDEPFAALDALTREEMQRFLVDVWRETKKTVIYVTHNVAEAVYLADRIIIFSPHPGTVKAQIRITLPRPRDTLSVEFLEYQKEIVRHIVECK